MLHFAGASSRECSAPLSRDVRDRLQATFTSQVSGTIDASGDDTTLLLLERRSVDLPRRFRHLASVTRERALLFSGAFYETDRLPPEADSEEFARAIAAFGADAMPQLAGDFVLAMCDRATGRVVLGSSLMGVLPLYMAETHSALVWSSSLAITRSVVDATEIDRPYLISYLSLERVLDRSPYQAIRSVRPGTALIFDPGRAPVLRDRTTFADRELRCRDEREYADRLVDVVTRAVADRMPCRGVLYTELSGGLDSGTTTLLASQVAKASGVTVRSLHYTSGSSPEWDETRFARAVARQADITTEFIDLDTLDFMHLPDDVTPEPALTDTRTAGSAVHAGGGEVILSGRIGDGIFGNTADNSLSALDHLRVGRCALFATRLIDWSVSTNQPAIGLAARMVLASVWPTRYDCVRTQSRRRKRSSSSALNGRAAPEQYALMPRALDEVRPHRLALAGLTARFVRPSKRALLGAVLGYSLYRRLENDLDTCLFLYPYSDRRVVDYLLSIPQELHAMPGRPRHLMRAAFGDLWPPELRARVSKGYAAPVTLRLFKPYAEALAAAPTLMLADMGIVDATSLRTRLELYLSGSGLRIGNLPRIWFAEEWLRRRDEAPSIMPMRPPARQAS